MVCCNMVVDTKRNLPIYTAAGGKNIDQSLQFIAYSAITLELTFWYLSCASWKSREVRFKGTLISAGLQTSHVLRRSAKAGLL